MSFFKQKVLFIAVAVGAFASANACSINVQSVNPNVDQALAANNGFEFKTYDAVCAKLKKANASLLINGHATVLAGQSVAWATATVSDRDLWYTTGTGVGYSTLVQATPSMDVAETMLYRAINEAAEGLDVDDGIVALQRLRERLRVTQ